MLQARRLAELTQTSPTLPGGTEERFSGYGVMGLPFRSGHVLGLRRFSASSIGRGYTSVWLRTPSGEWTFYQDVSPERSCARYFGPSLRRSVECPIEVRWTAADAFSVEIGGGRTLRWDVTLASPASIRAMNVMAAMMPVALWRSEGVLRVMGIMARHLLGTGRLALAGRAPSGQHFIANPLVAYTIPSSRAWVEGVELGDLGPIPEQDRLGDFWIPQRGLFVIGRALFEPFDPARHRLEVHSA